MAEIPIQPKHDRGGATWWPWVVGVLLLLLILWGLTSRRHTTRAAAGTYDTTTSVDTSSTPGIATPPAAGQRGDTAVQRP